MGEAKDRKAAAPVGVRRYVIFSAEVKAALVNGVARSGNAAATARSLGVSSSGLQKAQRDDPEFAAALRAARTTFRERRAFELTGVDPALSRDVPLRRTSGTRSDKVRFLRLLAELGSVKEAAGVMRVAVDSLYDARDADPVFARSWRRAHMRFLDMVKSELLSLSMKMVEGSDGDPKAATVKDVITVIDQAQEEVREACAAESAAPVGSAERRDLEAARLELENRLASLAERFGDPFALDPAAVADMAVAA